MFFFNGVNLNDLTSHEIKALQPRMQMVYQDADNSLDPRFTVYRILEEPLTLKRVARPERQTRIRDIMERANIGAELLLRRPPRAFRRTAAADRDCKGAAAGSGVHCGR